MRTVATSQAALYARSSVVPILLVRIITYTDRDAGTVQSTLNLSDRPVLYDYGNTGTDIQFEAMVAKVSDLTRSMNHIPGPSDTGALGAAISITLMNKGYRGETSADRFWPVLRALNLEAADIEIATVLADSAVSESWHDLRSYTGDEHIVHFRGRVTRIEGVSTDAIQLRAETRTPAIPWLYALDSSITDPKDLGARLPIVYGAARNVECINWQVGWTTTLTSSLAASSGAGTVLLFGNVDGFPSGSFDVLIDAERITLNAVNYQAGTANVVTRGVGGTPVIEHNAGTVAIEVLTEAIIVCAGHEVSRIGALRLVNPYNGELMDVTQGVRHVSDANVITGETVATVRFSASELVALAQTAFAASRVTVQPAYANAANLVTKTLLPGGALGTGTNGGGNIRYGLGGTSAADAYVNVDPNGGVDASRKMPFVAGQGLTTDVVLKYQVRFRCTGDFSTAYYTGQTCSADLFLYGFPGIANGAALSIPFTAGAGGATKEVYSAEISASGITEQSFIGAYCELRINSSQIQGMQQGNYVQMASGWGVIVTENTSPTLSQVTQAEIDGPSVGFGLRFYADVDGPFVPIPFQSGYAFDESAAGYSVSGCAASLDTSIKTEGTAALKVVVTETVFDDCESTAGWNLVNASIATNTTEKTHGTYGIQFQATGPNGTGYKQNQTPFNASGKLIYINCRLYAAASQWQALGILTATTGIAVYFTSNAAWGNNWAGFHFGLNAGLALGGDGSLFVTLVIDTALTPSEQSASAINWGAVNGWQILMQDAIGHGCLWYVDRWRVVEKTAKVQRNATAGVVDLRSPQATYRMALRSASAGDFEGGTLYFSNTAGSGTTKPQVTGVDTYRSVAFTAADIGNAAFNVAELASTDTSTPTLTDCETVGLTLNVRSTSPGVLLDVPTFWIDDLQRRDDASSPYGAAVGDLLEHPADVILALILLCGETENEIDATTFGAAYTNLGAAKIGCDLRGLGQTFAEVVMRLAYEARANLVRDEGASAATYRLHTAGVADTYAFGASVATVSQWQSPFAESGRDVGQISARWIVLYGYDPSVGIDTRAYLATLRADPTLSDFTGTTTTDLAAVEAKFGRREVQQIALRTIADPDTAKDVGGYYVAEGTRLSALFILKGVAWWEAFALERGDIVTLTSANDGQTYDARVIELVKSFTSEAIGLRVVQIP